MVCELAVYSGKKRRLPILSAIFTILQIVANTHMKNILVFSGAICSGGTDVQAGSECQHGASSGF